MKTKASEEMANIIYDTLMQNTMHDQFNLTASSEEMIGYSEIDFKYHKKSYRITVEEIK